jgi:hypothetical protein
MPHPPKQKISRKERAVERTRRSKQRKREKDEFAHIEYLKTQLDDKGNPLDILHTDEELLNNEQRFVVRIIKELSKFDPLSITNLIDEYYDDDTIDEIVNYYYSSKENKTWSDRLFKATYNCMRITNLAYLLKDDVLNNMDELFSQLSDTTSEKDALTEEIIYDIIENCRSDIVDEINMSEIINSLILVYVQNVQICYIGEYNGGRSKKKIQKGGGMLMLLLVVLILMFLWYVLRKKSFFREQNPMEQTSHLPTRVAPAIDYAQLERDRLRRAEVNARQESQQNPMEQTSHLPKREPTAEDRAQLERKVERDRLKRAEAHARQQSQ